jgi:hypothetical protein
MPYPNMPEDKWPVMDKCVNDVQVQGHDKQSAIAICYSSIMQEQTTANPIQQLWGQIQDLFKPLLERIQERAAYPWDKCMADQQKAGYSKKDSEKICGAIKSKYGNTREDSTDLALPADKTLDQILKEVQKSLGVKPAERMVIRQANGQYRWCGVIATAVLNHDGMIDSRALFDSFITRIEQTNEYPMYDVMHLGESARIGIADFVIRDGAAYFASGTFDDNEFAQAAARSLESNPDYWGHSIAFDAGEPDILRIYGSDIPVFTEGIHKFISVVPRDRAASRFTDVATLQTRSMTMMTDDQYNALSDLVGPELATKKRDELNQLNRTIEEAELIQRQKKESEAKPVVLEPVKPVAEIRTEEQKPVEPEARVVIDPNDLRVQIEGISHQLQDLVTMIGGVKEEELLIAERVKKLEQPIEQRIAQTLADAPAPKPQIITRPSVQRATGETKVDPTETLAALKAQRTHSK